ncbi:MAG: 4-(cytidine 5'-diphospho)-2-C-methyl-D-erythritol kinase [Ferruginibacter sp.]
MILFPNAKINIGLQITGKRPDGFHDIETIFYPVTVKDALEIISSDTFHFKVTGNALIDVHTNSSVKAWQLLRNDFPSISEINMHLHKNIPSGAGLGGGSADAAFCLQLLNTKYELGLSRSRLLGYALQLGSDCPFFIINTPCYATGRGEKLDEINLDLSAYRILIVYPGIHINTAEAFSEINKFSATNLLKEFVSNPVETWKNNIINDFEEPVFRSHPSIKGLKNKLYEHGALYASMSGSGSTVFGIFSKNAEPKINFPANYFFNWV